MVSEAQCAPEASDASQEDEDPLNSPQSEDASHTSGSDEDKAPSTKGDIKRLIIDLRKILGLSTYLQAAASVPTRRDQEYEDSNIHKFTNKLKNTTKKLQILTKD
ncbi:Hypothetical predicted protein [Pelobates cultripes]|uniref:Uncharacterized protein n=1 Tax=Pelobates cultripes TaxID=61616 RepID=A0AAD1WN11_PELCU|nr:Hypothetical predicted protein [Pelobates cultripes]